MINFSRFCLKDTGHLMKIGANSKESPIKKVRIKD